VHIRQYSRVREHLVKANSMDVLYPAKQSKPR
jgi:hypothetical protein